MYKQTRLLSSYCTGRCPWSRIWHHFSNVFGFECFSHYFLVSLPSYCLDFNAADERSLLEIVLYCISKLAVITSRYLLYFWSYWADFQNWWNIGPRGYPQPSFQIRLTEILQLLLFVIYDQNSQ